MSLHNGHPDKVPTTRRGGPRVKAGRPKGSLNIARYEDREALAEMARSYTPEALATVIHVMRTSAFDSIRLAAVSILFDRGYGKPSQAIQIDSKQGAVFLIRFASAEEGEIIDYPAAREISAPVQTR